MLERANLLQMENRLYTLDLEGGRSVYGEAIIERGGRKWREWVPWRSKLAAYIRKKGLPEVDGSSILYLGAAQGTTVSHISDLLPEGAIYAVEVSRTAFGPLSALSRRRKNIVPVLGDAFHPEAYRLIVGSVDTIYQDVAQKDQLGMFLKNTGMFLRKGGKGFLMLKTRSIDVTADPDDMASRAVEGLKKAGMNVLDITELGPFQKDHSAIFMELPRG